MRLCANLSMLWPDRPMEERFAAAAEAGFDGVEIQFPHEHDLAALQRAKAAAGLPVVLINVPRGPGDSVGLAALPGAEEAFRAAVETCRRFAEGLGAEKVNILSGRTAGMARADCARTLTANLRHVADVFAQDGRKVMLEPVNPHDVPGFHLTTLAQAQEALAAADHPNLALQFDFYHMAITEPDLCEAIVLAGPQIGHVQFADTPGRHEPGTGVIDFAAALAALRGAGYDDAISAEYRPAAATEAGLGWMAAFREKIR